MKRKASFGKTYGPRKRRRTKLSAKAVRKIARRAIMGLAETKSTVLQTENQQLYHNNGSAALSFSPVLVGNLLRSTQGTDEETRIGDKVEARNLSIKLWLSNKSDRSNVIYRVMVIATPPDQVAVASPAGLFENYTGNKLLDHINTNRYRVIRDKTVSIHTTSKWTTTGASLQEQSKLVKMNIKLKGRTVTYSAESGQVPKNQQNCLSLVVIPYDAFGTLTLDNIASCGYVTRFYYKDI